MEDEDSCRICRSGPEPGAPLYHPCKCTGSIRYCHQDCLVEWLQHSRKKYCELCNHPFLFHKKYRNDMPSDGKLPRYLYARRLVIRAVQVTQLVARALLVGFTWLALLPYININVWRFMFWSIDVVTWMGAPFDMQPPPANQSASAIHAVTSAASNGSAAANLSADSQHRLGSSASLGRTRNGSAFPPGTLAHAPISLENAKSALRSFANKMVHDCFQGQILSCVIVVFFVGVFLLREWILQNIPQNFDHPPNLDGAPQPLPNADAQPPQPPAELQAQLRADFEQRRDQLERLLAGLPELEPEERPAEAADEHEPAPNHELDLDPEVQREQARQARIRRLEQMFADAGDEVAERPTRQVPASEENDDSNALHSQKEADANGSSEVAEAEHTDGFSAAAESSTTQTLQDVLGWSERAPQQFLDAKLGALAPEPAQATASDSHLDTVDAEQAASDGAIKHMQHEQEQGDPRSSQQTLNGDSSSNAGTTEPVTQADAPDHGSAEATVAQAEAHTEAVQALEPFLPEDEPGAWTVFEVPDGQEDDDDAWEDESDGGAGLAGRDLDQADQAELRAAAAAAFPPPIAHPIADDEIEIGMAPEADDPEAEIGLAEEMDGILEAIGMRGPVFGIVQNLFLMIFLCGFVMLAFVMAPYIVGRALGSGPGLVKLLALPVKTLRYVTDPVFDFVIALGANNVWPKIAAAVGMQSGSANNGSALVSDAASVSSGVGAGWIQRLLPSAISSTTAKDGTAAAEQVLGSSVAAKTSATAALLVELLPASVTSSSQWKAVSDSFDVALATGLAGTLQSIGDHVSAFFVRLDAHRMGSSGTDRAFCVAFGHCYWLLVLFVHQYFSKPDLQRAMADQSALKMFMDQHVLILKAISFIFIELAVFPLGCGLLFDICTMPFLADASVLLWPAKIRAAPLSFAFTRWMGGTIYMFVFAQYVSATRKVLRPGVLCWIRDPNDPSFHPIREILDKKSLTQLRKIGASAVMYAAILVASVGVNTYFVRYALGWTGLLPLRWRPFEPLTEVPIDLLMVHFALPWATRKMDPEKMSEAWLSAWWKGAARALRLSSYMIGGEFKDEQRRPKGNAFVAAWQALWYRKSAAEGEEGWVEDGQMCRVPDDDKAITSGPLIIPLRPDGTPPTERLAEAIAKQEADAEKHTPKPTYTQIYLPSNYRLRITTILTLLWLSHCALFILGLGVPLVLGRSVVTALKGREVHDFYSFTLGFTLLVVSTRVIREGRRIWKRRARAARMHRTSPRVYVAVHLLVKVKRFYRAIFLLIGVAGLVPLLIGLLVDQYVLSSLRYAGDEARVVHLGQVWACGVIETRLLLFGARFFGIPANGMYARFMSNVDHVVRGGIYPRPRVHIAWKRIVLPLTCAASLLLLAPFAIAHLLATTGCVKVGSRHDEQQLLTKTLGAIQTIVVGVVVRAVVRRRMESWTDLLKDEVFLESTELKNYDAAPNAQSEEAEAGTEYVAEGTLPDVLFR